MAQMLFVVGHVAIKQIAHLEAIDRHWKARRASKESQASKDKKAAASAAAIAPVPTGKKGKDKTAASVAAAEAADELVCPTTPNNNWMFVNMFLICRTKSLAQAMPRMISQRWCSRCVRASCSMAKSLYWQCLGRWLRRFAP